MKKEKFELRDYLVKNNYPHNLIVLLDDLFIHKSLSTNELETVMENGTAKEFVQNYKLRGANNA
ncbi:hypothetical protein [Streptococcus uberis]|uniref:hypothetical protein n=1 Tax=Streptococcus uberis TaxID=1349 RepID=UPI003EF4D6A6